MRSVGPAALAALLGLAAPIAAGCQGPGPPKAGAPAHHLERGFRNVNPDYARPDLWTRWRFVVPRLLSSTFAAPADFPMVPNDAATIRAPAGEAWVTWVGHSTVLVQVDGVRFLTDPIWSERASPFSFAGPRRVMPPGVRFEDLPPIDFVLVSHDHYDHLDAPTLARLWAAHRPRFFAPLGLKAWFAELGIDDVEELDWWERRTFEGVAVVSTPVQHWSARSLRDQNRRLWAGWAVLGPTRRFYFGGDTGYYPPIFREIGRRLGPFDLAALPIGAYLPRAMMRFSHLTPDEALRVRADIEARRLLAIHWGTFDLAEEPLGEPPARLEADARRAGVAPDAIWILRHGETRRW